MDVFLGTQEEAVATSAGRVLFSPPCGVFSQRGRRIFQRCRCGERRKLSRKKSEIQTGVYIHFWIGSDKIWAKYGADMEIKFPCSGCRLIENGKENKCTIETLPPLLPHSIERQKPLPAVDAVSAGGVFGSVIENENQKRKNFFTRI